MIKSDDRFCGAASGFEADASADADLVIVLKKSVGAAFMLALDTPPISDERADFALHSGDDGDATRSHFLGTTLPHGAMRFLQE